MNNEDYAPIQTRSEVNGIKYTSTVYEAFENAKKDLSIWKISFDAHTGERIRLIRSQDGFTWYYESIYEAINNLVEGAHK